MANQDPREVTIPFDRPQGGIMRAIPKPAGEHPMRCDATFPAVASDHEHQCIHPPQRPHQTAGVPEHECDCGAKWIEAKRVSP